MRSSQKIRKFFALIKTLFRVLWIIIFIHWIFWATTYARASHYERAIRDEKITQHTGEDGKTSRYKDRAEGWMGKVFENKPDKVTIGEIEEDVLSQIEAETGKTEKSLPREWTQQEPELERLDQEIKVLRDKKDSLSDGEKKELEQKKDTYGEKLAQARLKVKDNIEKQLSDSKLSITELNDRRGFGGRLFIDPLKFFLVTPLNQTCKVFQILGRPQTPFFLAEVIFKIIVVKLFCLWISYPESVSRQMQENYQKVQNPHLSLEEKEQIQREMGTLARYQIFNLTVFFLSWLLFLHPAHLDKTKSMGPFSKDVPLPYVLLPLLLVPFFLSVYSAESLRLGRWARGKDIKTLLGQGWFFLIGVFGFGLAWASQNQGNYWWFLLGFMISFLFDLIRLQILRHKSDAPSHTFRVVRVRGNPSSGGKVG